MSACNGILPVYKERGYTSADVVALLRGILSMKKIGHTGTLDPEAEGVLPCCLGKGTKLAGMLTDTDKAYRCTMRLGIKTDTEDMTGTVLEERDINGIGSSDIEKALMGFVGPYDQVPPMYSAKKVDGKRLYEYARDGVEIQRKSVRVEILSLRILNVALPLVTFETECSKGTYIRSLCRDAGEVLGCGAAMEELIRIRAGIFSLKDCLTLKEIEELKASGNLSAHIVPPDKIFSEYPEFRSEDVTSDRLLKNGNRLLLPKLSDGKIRAYLSDGRFAGLYEIRNGTGKCCAFFLT
ncbi:MAG: tRNA pseudouridine(55) synthase TruB [Lachnospiraceae bacterium]|nr:tRNA pseudouridine(55) synthase TruB [Lachnospiraceae bacterium]